jgi:hypothetical protein
LEQIMVIDWDKFRQIAKAIVRAEINVEEASTIATSATNVSQRINVCTEIKCPYSFKTSQKSSSGCRKYSVAGHCHLLRGRPELKKEASQYFLHSDVDSVNIAELKLQNDSFFLDSSDNRESLENEMEFGDQILYAPYSEETFDLAAYLKQ